MLPVIHQLLHICLSIQKTGPMTTSWQVVIEEYIGYLGSSRSKKSPNEHLALLMLIVEQLKLIPYCIPNVGIGKGGVAGTGLDASVDEEEYDPGDTEKMITENGRLKLVNLFSFCKEAVDEHCRRLNSNTPYQTVSIQADRLIDSSQLYHGSAT